jgi:hypothetical protein
MALYAADFAVMRVTQSVLHASLTGKPSVSFASAAEDSHRDLALVI